MFTSTMLLGLSLAIAPTLAVEPPPGAACPHLRSLSDTYGSSLARSAFDAGLPIGVGELDWDDDGDCFCEVGPCEGSSRPECGQLEDGDCMDNPNDERAKHVNPDRDEACDDMVDNDCNGLVNDGCSDTVRYATVQGGGCHASAPARLSLFALLLALPLVLRLSRAANRS
jgi:hypothetical protein